MILDKLSPVSCQEPINPIPNFGDNHDSSYSHIIFGLPFLSFFPLSNLFISSYIPMAAAGRSPTYFPSPSSTGPVLTTKCKNSHTQIPPCSDIRPLRRWEINIDKKTLCRLPRYLCAFSFSSVPPVRYPPTFPLSQTAARYYY